MDFELKEFEQKINSITEQFMSLLDSNDVVEGPIEECSPYKESTNSYDAISSFKGEVSGSIFRVGADTVNFGGIGYQDNYLGQADIPKHAIMFDSGDHIELDKRLESLYEDKKHTTFDVTNEKPNIAFSDSNIGKINSLGINGIYESYKNETDSTLNNKEVYEMAGYNGEEKKDNIFYSFATVPAEQALVEKKDWKEVLFMDIPWDTKIDIWGGIKKFCTAQVKITFE